MLDELDTELTRLFADSREPLADEDFAAGLMVKMGRARRARLWGWIAMAALVVLIAALNLQPMFETAAGAVRMVGELSPASTELLFTPWGAAASMLAAIWLLLRLRPSRR
jgi:uncharacterized membrane protein YhaH (DUF805 family)